MITGICHSISSALGIENKTLVAAAPCLAIGTLYAGTATVALGLRVASIAAESLGQEELSDSIEEVRVDLVALAKKNIETHAKIGLCLTAISTAAVAIHGLAIDGKRLCWVWPQREPVGLIQRGTDFFTDVYNRKYF